MLLTGHLKISFIVQKPVSSVQKLNIYVPEAYYQGKTINGYDLKTAPVFAPNTVGGYMEGPAMEVGIDPFNHKPNTAFEALLHGYVVLCAGIRDVIPVWIPRNFLVGGSGKENTGKEEKLTGRAPAIIVDMKAAIRYMRYNADVIPGDVERSLQMEHRQEVHFLHWLGLPVMRRSMSLI